MNRKEYKFIMSNEELNDFFKQNYQNLNSIYASRKISNLYFDTLGFNVYSNNLLMIRINLLFGLESTTLRVFIKK